MRKLTKKELEFLKKLQEDNDLQFKGLIRKFIIGNTYEPKYKLGDYVKVTEGGHHYIWGCRVVNVNCKIDEINWHLNDKGKETIQYCCTAYDQFGHDHLVIAEESIHGYSTQDFVVGRSDTDQNTFEKKSKYSDCSYL